MTSARITTSILVVTALASSGCASRKGMTEVAVGSGLVLAGAAGISAQSPGDDASTLGGALIVTGAVVLAVGVVRSLTCIDCNDPPLSMVEAAGVLVLVNSPKETAESLAEGARIERAVATRITAYRDGADRTPRTADDDRFDTVAELRAIDGVTRDVVDRLVQRAYALDYAR